MKILDKNLDNYQALIFDFDGTLVDSMPYHNQAWLQALKDHGVDIDLSFLKDYAGITSIRIIEEINRRQNLKLNPHKVSQHKRDLYFTNMDKVTAVPALMQIVHNYYLKVPLAIITGGSHKVVDTLLQKLRLEHFFNCVICAEDTDGGKDSVEPYELASQKLQVDIRKCLFFDDGDAGLNGARLSGMDIMRVDVNSKELFQKTT